MTINSSLNKNNKTLNKIIKFFSSVEKQQIVIAIITLLVITGILCSKYFVFQVVSDKGISKHVILADRNIEIIDKKSTIAKKEEAASKVKPVYQPILENVNKNVENNLQKLIDSINNLRKEYSNEIKRTNKLPDLSNNTRLSGINDDVLRYLLSDASNYSWKFIQDISKKTTAKLLEKGVSEETLTSDKKELIKSYVPDFMSKANKDATIALVDTVIDRPNLAIDKEATKVAINNAIDRIENIKVYYKKGQVVIDRGESVTSLKYEALRQLGYAVNEIDWLVLFGVFCFVTIVIYIVWYYLSRYEPKYANSIKHLLLLSTLSIITLSIYVLISSIPKLFQVDIPVYIIPMAAVTLIITFFTNARISLLTTAMIIFLIVAVFHFSMEDILVIVIGCVVAVFKISKTTYYKDLSLIKCGIAVALAQILIVMSDYLVSSNMYYDSEDFNEMIFKIFIALLSGFLTGAITIAAMPHLEAVFKIITPHGLIELADQNQPLLRRLQFEAPGTYHHSLMVSTLAEAAAEAIGASTVLVRVGAFYHDIGKLRRPSFFIENQAYFGSENPHDKLNPRLSKMVLTAHTKDGLELSKQYKLPESIQNIIIEHHGEGVMLFFYRSALDLEGPDKVLKDQFRYSGPKPSSKESAIVMLADATESAVRSLKNPSVTAIEEMIMKIFDERLSDGQLSDSPLTLHDIKVISSTFIRVLKGMQHYRVEYKETTLKELRDKQIEHGFHKPETQTNLHPNGNNQISNNNGENK